MHASNKLIYYIAALMQTSCCHLKLYAHSNIMICSGQARRVVLCRMCPCTVGEDVCDAASELHMNEVCLANI